MKYLLLLKLFYNLVNFFAASALLMKGPEDETDTFMSLLNKNASLHRKLLVYNQYLLMTFHICSSK